MTVRTPEAQAEHEAWLEQRTVEAADKLRADLESGEAFRLAARVACANRTFPGRYDAPLTTRQFQAVLKAMADLARSDSLAQLVSEMGMPNPYGTAWDLQDFVARKVLAKITEGWDDVHGRTGPEPIRYSDAQKQFTLAARIVAYAFIVRMRHIDPAVGGISGYPMGLERLAKLERVTLPPVKVEGLVW